MKKTISVTVDVDAYQKAVDMGLNISAACEQGLFDAVMGMDGGEACAMRQQANEMLTKADEAEAKLKMRREMMESALNEFMGIGRGVIDTPKALAYWSKRTGKTTEELIKIKRGF